MKEYIKIKFRNLGIEEFKNLGIKGLRDSGIEIRRLRRFSQIKNKGPQIP